MSAPGTPPQSGAESSWQRLQGSASSRWCRWWSSHPAPVVPVVVVAPAPVVALVALAPLVGTVVVPVVPVAPVVLMAVLTVTEPTMPIVKWKRQKYGNVPAVSKVKLKVSPGWRSWSNLPSGTPFTPEVTVCSMVSVLVHTTVCPCWTVMVCGVNLKLVAVTLTVVEPVVPLEPVDAPVAAVVPVVPVVVPVVGLGVVVVVPLQPAVTASARLANITR